MQTTKINSKNFSFLAEHDPLLEALAAAAEDAFFRDPNTTLIKLRQLGEALAQHLASISGVELEERLPQLDLLQKLEREIRLDKTALSLFHLLRREGNKATHQFETQHKEAINGLQVAHKLAQWFHQNFGSLNSNFKPQGFQKLTDPSKKLLALQQQIALLEAKLDNEDSQQNNQAALAQLLEDERQEYDALLEIMDEESKQQAEKIQQQETELARLQEETAKKISQLQTKLATQTAAQKPIKHRPQALYLNEELTRILIDEQLNKAGWQADTTNLTYAKGTRPQKGKNLAIAEWPVKGGKADYVLFAGLIPLAIVEAKKENTDVAGKIDQAENYSKNFVAEAGLTPAWQFLNRTIAWPVDEAAHYFVPFVYSCNGRPYVHQLKEKSGIWFRDVTHPANIKRALTEFHSPEGLLDLLKRDTAKAEAELAAEPFAYLGLRDYQQAAVQAAEEAIENNQRKILLAMATGTGKTRTVLGLIYRLLKTERFKRILFLVDRTSLGDQALEAFTDTTLEQNQSLTKIYNVAHLGDQAAAAETRVQVATVQAMVKRIFASDTPPLIDEFDCVIVDEAHRGYTLDQEMTDGELALRDASQYISSYRRVLDYFDAVKIGLTATPALHTKEIFGKPVFTYSYREAVAADWLIDHEPPIRYITQLSQAGINFKAGEKVDVIDITTGEVKPEELEDELNFEVDAFNRRVINENFNRVICKELVKELDPFSQEKTLIYCVTDLHADMVKRLLDEEFKNLYGNEYKQAAVAKITGQSHKVSQLIREFKNEKHPNIAITVDLLTTGIDVPNICNLVFLRRVKSRILYEQMLGRATRRSDKIGKTVFRIYDPVDIYTDLEDVNTMKPLVKNPNISLEQLIDELANPQKLEQALNAPGIDADETHADLVLSQVSQKVMRVLRKAEQKAEHHPQLKQQLANLEQQWQVEPKNLHSHLKQLGPTAAANFLNQHTQLVEQLEEIDRLIGSDYKPVISEHPDELEERIQTYGENKKPADYLESFNEFIKKHINQSAALSVVVTRPKDLTRQQLKEVKLLLDQAGYSEASLQSAVKKLTNQDIAASILGHIRQAALGEALIPFEKRVDQGMERLLQSHPWTVPQRNWLKRLAKQLVHEVILDHEFVNQRFAENGGAKQLDKVLNQQLDQVIDELSEAIWLVG